MKLFQFVKCNECNMEYQIIWEDDDFQEPCKCAGCGGSDTKVIHAGAKF